MNRRPSTDRSGFALEATLIMLILLTMLIGAGLAATMMVQRSAGVDYRGARVTYAAESGADHVMSQLEGDIQDGSITDPELAALTPPAITGFNVTVSGARVGAPVPKTIATGPYTGLFGLNQQIDITVHADDPQANRADAIVSVNAQSIPLFQFGVFYEGDLEIHNGPPMTFAGWVHTNGNLYLSSDNTFFQDLITTPRACSGTGRHTRTGGTASGSTTPPPYRCNLTFDSRSQPTPNGFKAASQASFDGRLMTSAHGVTPLRLPLPAGMPAIELIQAAVGGRRAGRAQGEGGVAGGHVREGGPEPARHRLHRHHVSAEARRPADARRRRVPAHLHAARRTRSSRAVKTSAWTCSNVDVGALENWIAANYRRPPRGHPLYHVHQLQRRARHRGLSGGTPDQRRRAPVSAHRSPPIAPVYVQGDYNSVGWRPSAILGDAVTFLSAGWVDAAHTVFPGAPTVTSGEMWVFAAIAAGHSATPCDYQDAGCPGNRYGGGLGELPPLPRELERRPDALPRLAGVALQQPGRRPPRVVVAPLLRSAVA